jgi:hypothetical protein
MKRTINNNRYPFWKDLGTDLHFIVGEYIGHIEYHLRMTIWRYRVRKNYESKQGTIDLMR